MHGPARTRAHWCCSAPALASQVTIYAGNPNPARTTATQAVLEARCTPAGPLRSTYNVGCSWARKRLAAAA